MWIFFPPPATFCTMMCWTACCLGFINKDWSDSWFSSPFLPDSTQRCRPDTSLVGWRGEAGRRIQTHHKHSGGNPDNLSSPPRSARKKKPHVSLHLLWFRVQGTTRCKHEQSALNSSDVVTCSIVQKMWASSCWKRRTLVRPVSVPDSSFLWRTPKSASLRGSSLQERGLWLNIRLQDKQKAEITATNTQ